MIADRWRRSRSSTALIRPSARRPTLEAISGRTINMAIGIVMHQRALSPEDAEDLRVGAATGSSPYEAAAYVVRSGALNPSRITDRPPGRPGLRTRKSPAGALGQPAK
jgi:hypothetical protein